MRNLDFQINQQQNLQNPVFQEARDQNLSMQQQPFYQQHPELLQGKEDSQAEGGHGRQAIQFAKSRQRAGMRGTVGEIVQVQGGHIVRSTGRKDRHSKVCTAKGPRDRRVRLSAHTAIEFYDVQDRLGYDRPSKAVDWLIKKAKSAIDKLDELPPWNPTANETMETDQNVESSEMPIGEQSESSSYSFHLHRSNESSFVTPTIDPVAVPDTMKSLFPTSSTNSSMILPSYPADMISRTTNHTEDLGLSLHSFPYQGLFHGQSEPGTSHTPSNELAAGSAQAEYEANLMGWNPLSVPLQQVMLSQGSTISHRGSLQSNFSQSIQEIHHQPFIFGSRFTPQGLAGYSFPPQIHGETEQNLVSNRPSTSSPNTHH